MDIVPGKIIRFGKNKSDWALLFPDGLGGVLGSWKTGEQHVWQAVDAKRMDATERARFQDAINKAKAQAKADRESEYREAAIKAQAHWDKAVEPDLDHKYLVSKWVKAHGIKQKDDDLLIPVYSVMGDMQSLQKIRPNGSKQFMPGGKMAGGCHMIGFISKDQPIIICEGYATAATLYEDGNPFVVVAFTAHNLVNVAKELRAALPQIEIIIAGDDDRFTEGNPGRTKATEAAKAVNGKAIFPKFNDYQDDSLTDFNDLHRSISAKK